VRAVAGSIVCGAYTDDDGAQVGFARAVTDGTTFGWICDVYVERAVRGQGIGRAMVATLRDDLVYLGVPRLILATRDAHGVYAPLGFTPVADAEQWMELDTRFDR
jgi:GNAT superfamily N-acetyltransferase